MTKLLTVIGLGAGDLEQLPLGIYKQLKQTKDLYLRTKEHPVIKELEQEGVQFESFDAIYEKHEQFDAVYEEIVSILLEKVQDKDIVYGVPGHPMVAERTVQLLIEKCEQLNIRLNIAGGQSFLDALFQSVKMDPIEGFQLLDGTALKLSQINPTMHQIIGQVYDSFVASEVKLTLMEKFPDDYEVFIVTAAGSSNEKLTKVHLYELDHDMELNNLTSVYVPPVQNETVLYKEFSKLRDIIAALRGPDGCPWDQKQTHQSLKKYLIEESYELLEAIDEDDPDHIVEELGDVLLQVMLHAQIGEDEGMFSISDVIEGITDKMIRRHPHVFGNKTVENEEEVVQNWQQIKQQEKGLESYESLLTGVNKAQPNTLRAFEYQKRAAKVGFDWKEVQPAWEKVKEELEEFSEEMNMKTISESRITDEFGDILFALINIARFYNINPEEALASSNQKFYRRFRYIEEQVNGSGKNFDQFTLEELDQYWENAKRQGL